MNYKSYLKSDLWRDKKKNLVKTEIKMCWVCHRKNNLNVHHLTYDRLGKEDNEDLIYLCSKHHRLLHYLKKRFTRKNDFEILGYLKGNFPLKRKERMKLAKIVFLKSFNVLSNENTNKLFRSIKG